MRPLMLICLLALAVAGAVIGQVPGGTNQLVQSRSGQFSVYGRTAYLPSPGYLNAPDRTNHLQLNHARVAVISERIKQALLAELGAADHWKSKIAVTLRQAADLEEPVFVKAQYTRAGWFYRVDLPSEIRPALLLRTMVAVLLQEMADRRAGERPAELPPWLVPGLAAQLETMAGQAFILENQTETVRIERRIDPLAEIRRRLGDELPPSLDDLNWPPEAQLEEPPLGYFESCSQLFLLSLRRLPGGGECLRAMVLDQAAQHLNWQTAFLQAFARHFPTLRDADKWWSVQVAGFTGRDTAQTYTVRESWQKLEAILAAPVSIHVQTNRLPEHKVVTLQTVIRDWDYGRQKTLLRQKISQLHVLRSRVAPDLLRLTDDYRMALEAYVSRRGRAGFAPEARSAMADSPRLIVRKTVERLEVLDIVRRDLKAATLAEPEARPEGK